MHTRQRAFNLAIRVAATISLIGVAAATQPGVALATGCTNSWNTTSGTGAWTHSANWSVAVPLATEDVCLPTGSETVELDGTIVAVAKTISIGAGATLVLKGTGAVAIDTTLTVANGVTNAGTIQIGSAAHTRAATLAVSSGVLTNTGTIVTAGSQNNLNANVDNQASGTINDAFPLEMIKVNGVYTNNGTWTVTGQTEISNVQSFTMAGGSIAGSAIFHVTGGASGTFDHTGGTITATTNVENVSLKPRSSSGSGTLKVVRSATTLGSDISVNDTVVIDGGFASDDGVLTSTVDRTNNGTIRLTSMSGSKTAKLIFTGATLTNNGTIETPVASASNPVNTGPDRFIQGNVINNGTININYGTKFPTPSATFIQNSGTTDLEANLNLTGSAGTLDLAGGTLKGTGTLTGQLQNDGGTVAPGNSPGVLTVTDFTQGAGGTLAMEVGGTIVGSEDDRLVVTGNASLGGTLALTPLFGFVPDLSFDYDVLTSGSQGGTFATVTGTNVGGGETFVVSYSGTAVNLTAIAPSITRRPDGQIAIGSGSLAGNNVYNTDGTGQSKSKTGTAGTKVTFTLRIENDGTGAKDKFKVHATGLPVSGYTIVFKRGTTNITLAVVNDTYTTGKIAVGAHITIKVTVTITSGAAHAGHVDRLVTLTSVNDTGQTDAVKLTVGRT
jgi:fibronectin-binding autotransporter adhesin